MQEATSSEIQRCDAAAGAVATPGVGFAAPPLVTAPEQFDPVFPRPVTQGERIPTIGLNVTLSPI